MLGLASAWSATHSPWPDARHGWEVRGDVDTGGLYSTEDGGRHWHLIYPAAGVDIMGFLRTSAAAGVLSIDFRAPEQYWTGDNGRHWTRTRRLPAFWQAGTNLAGKGPALFWSRARVLYQVANWPPHRRRALRLRRVVRVPDGMFTDLAWIPGGVSGAVLRDGTIPNASVARVLLIRHGYCDADSVAHALRIMAGTCCARRGRSRKSCVQVALQRRRPPLVQLLAGTPSLVEKSPWETTGSP